MVEKVAKTTSSDVTYHEVPLEWIVPNSRNYNQHPPEQIAALKASLERFGQVRPYVVKQVEKHLFLLVAGEGTLRAAQELVQHDRHRFAHLAQAKIMIVPQSWTDLDVRAYMVADNETAKKASPDEEILFLLLQEQQEAGFSLLALGSDEEILRQMVGAEREEYQEGASRGSLGKESPTDFASYDEQIETQYCCPKCGYEWSGKPK